jgi:hypothetical protein
MLGLIHGGNAKYGLRPPVNAHMLIENIINNLKGDG